MLAAIERPGAAPVAIVSISSVHWADGAVLDVAAIARAVRARGAVFLIDATQSAGVLDLDVRTARSGFRRVPDL